MGKLVSHYAAELFSLEQPHNSCGCCYCCVAWISAGCKGIGRIIFHDVYLWHGKPRLHCQLSGDGIQLRLFRLCYRLCPIYQEHYLVTEPICPEIHDARKHKGHCCTTPAAQGIACKYEN